MTQYESNVACHPDVLRELQEKERGPFMISANGNLLILRELQYHGETPPPGAAPANIEPGLRGLTLHWHGHHSARTALFDSDGRNLFQVFRVKSLEFKADSAHPDGDAELHLRLELWTGFKATNVRATVALDDLRALAAAHGYELSPVPTTESKRDGGRPQEPPNELFRDDVRL